MKNLRLSLLLLFSSFANLNLAMIKTPGEKEHYESVQEKNLVIASERGDLNAVRDLLRQKISANAASDGKWTALMGVCCFGGSHIRRQFLIVKELIRAGADPRTRTMCDGQSALEFAVIKGRVDLVTELL